MKKRRLIPILFAFAAAVFLTSRFAFAQHLQIGTVLQQNLGKRFGTTTGDGTSCAIEVTRGLAPDQFVIFLDHAGGTAYMQYPVDAWQLDSFSNTVTHFTDPTRKNAWQFTYDSRTLRIQRYVFISGSTYGRTCLVP